jgi:aristolochene synthase
MLLYQHIEHALLWLLNYVSHQKYQPALTLESKSEYPPSRLVTLCHPLVEDVVKETDAYFLLHWNFPNEKSRLKFIHAGFARVSCFYFPMATNDRIHLACRLITLLFLVDG